MSNKEYPFGLRAKGYKICPSCSKKRFKPYVWFSDNEEIGEGCGRCERIDNCNYHVPPKEYFKEYPDARRLQPKRNLFEKVISDHRRKNRPVKDVKRKVFYMNRDFFNIAVNSDDRHNHNFAKGLLFELFGNRLIECLERYHVTCWSQSGRVMKGGTSFWLVDADDKIRSSQIVMYSSDGKREKGEYSQNWSHRFLYETFTLSRCFFGSHLLSSMPDFIGIVESPKSAIIASSVYDNAVFLASCGSNCLQMCIDDAMRNDTAKRAFLNASQVRFFPDASPDDKQYQQWRKVAANFYLKEGVNCELDEMVLNVSDNEKIEGFDIADFLVSQSLS